MQNTKLAEICDFYDVGKPLQALSIGKPGFMHKVIRLETANNFYLMKRYSLDEKNQLVVMRKLLNIIFEREILISRPIINHKKYFYVDKNYCWLLFPWIEGNCLELDDIRQNHVQVIAGIIGKIHGLSITLPNAMPIISVSSDKDIFKQLQKNDYVSMQECYKKFHLAKKLLDENLIISHGDLLAANVIWKSKNQPVLIDWDHCGLINQDIDLFNTAINWAGIESGQINMDMYRIFMDIYYSVNPRPIHIGPKLIHASFGSWFQWLAFTMKKMPKRRAGKQLVIALNALKYLLENDRRLSITLT